MADNEAPRLGLAGAGIPAVDKTKARDGVRLTIPAGRLKGIEMVVRIASSENPHQNKFVERWAEGEFVESIKARIRGQDEDPLDEEKLLEKAGHMTRTPEYIAHSLIADLPQGIDIPEKVDALDVLPESIRDAYKQNGKGFVLKGNRKNTVGYTPDVGVWLIQRYPELGDWATRFARREREFLEERTAHEGNA